MPWPLLASLGTVLQSLCLLLCLVVIQKPTWWPVLKWNSSKINNHPRKHGSITNNVLSGRSLNNLGTLIWRTVGDRMFLLEEILAKQPQPLWQNQQRIGKAMLVITSQMPKKHMHWIFIHSEIVSCLYCHFLLTVPRMDPTWVCHPSASNHVQSCFASASLAKSGTKATWFNMIPIDPPTKLI